MKIEKVNDQQIRCTLTRDDLVTRQLKLSELAYGTEKAKILFRDMMQQASFEFGFEAEDIPLMIEAIPLDSECIILIITKVEDPEELDTRFAKFAPSVHEDMEYGDFDSTSAAISGASDILDLFKSLHEGKFADLLSAAKEDIASAAGITKTNRQGQATIPGLDRDDSRFAQVYAFDSIGDVTRVANVLQNHYNGINTLYKDNNTGVYKLVITKSTHSPEEFNKICNILSEYGRGEKCSDALEAFMDEHFKLIARDDALQTLAQI